MIFDVHAIDARVTRETMYNYNFTATINIHVQIEMIEMRKHHLTF